MEIDSTAPPPSSSSAVMELNAICRLCLSDKNDSLKSLFDEILGPNRLSEKIEHLLQVKICKNDKFPTMICNDCIIRLDTWFAYKNQCHRNQTKLAEWIKIPAKSSASTNNDEKIQDAVLQIKKEPTDDADTDTSGIMVPVKVELNYNEEFPDESTSIPQNESIIMSVENNPADVNTSLETDDDRQCPDCGKVFGTFLNRRRHQNAMHTKKERRYQMKEINILKRDHEESAEPEMKPTTVQVLKNEIKKPKIYNSEAMDPIIHLTAENSYEPTTTSVVNSTNAALVKESKAKEIIKDAKLKLLTENDEKKIEFAAGLRLLQKDSSPIELEPLSKIEQSYIEKCRAMVSMFHTLQCACHNGQHKTLRNLLSHLRETRVWFPLFTCYNCMISLTDRSTFTRHYTKCPKPQLETLITLSNVRKRSEVKVRIYQNFKCNRCKFLFSFHEDFCKHVDEEHANGAAPFYCSCNCTPFDSVEEFRNHCYSSCILSYYCDICFETTSTIEEFIKHAQEHHDSSEGFILRQDDNYLPRSQHFRHKEVADAEGNNVVEGKRERRKSTKDPVTVQIYDREVPNNNQHETTKDLSVTGIKKLIQMDETNSISWNKNPTRCPLCRKQYSTVNNMVRHYKGHIEKQEVELPKIDIESGNEDLYTCPDCGGVYPASQWPQHLEEKHTPKKCTECDKEFQFEAELNQHRSVHLNIKVYRDSITHSYKSTMVNLNDQNREMLEICEICDEMFDTKEELTIHRNDEHEDDGGATTSLVDIASNLEVTIEDGEAVDEEEIEPTTDDEKPFCEPCGRPFASEKSYREHVLSKHDSSLLKKGRYPKKCAYCDKTCGTGAALKGHMMWHDRMNMTELEKSKSEFPKKCEYCDKICSTKAGLYLHTQMHERVTLGELKKKKDDNNKRNINKIDDVDETEMDIDKEDESYFTCKRCFKVFGNKSKLKEHLKSHGVFTKTSPKKTRKVLCDQCHVSFENRDALMEHKAEEHNGMDDEDDIERNNDRASETTTLFNCQYCEHISYTKQEQKVHKETHKWNSKTNELNCKLCKISFPNIKELTNHMQKQHIKEQIKPKIERGPKGFRCPLCPKLFQSHNAMTTHSGWHKRLGNYPVMVENTPQARTASKLIRKQKVLKKLTAPKAEPLEMPPEFQCSICFMELSNETALQIHCLEKHGNLDASVLIPRCETCNQDFDSQEGYEKHKRFHVFLERQIKQEKNPVISPAGPPPAVQLQNVQNIAGETYQNNKKYCCSWCNSSFTRQDTLNSHIKSHHKEFVRTDFECPDCKRVFDKQNALSIHLKVHQKQKNFLMHQSQGPSSSVGKVYVCSLCNMAFNYPKDLRMHTIKAHPFF